MTSAFVSAQTFRAVIKRFFERPWAVFALVFAWKVALLAFTAQPVPSNDSFFYDGPVVNLLLHGKYANPSLAMALPISGTEVFCAYPPLYQLVLLVWMSLFGCSAISAMALHMLLFGVCLWLILVIFRWMKLPVLLIHVAAGMLLLITFQDRPDSLAHVFGLAAVYAWIRSRRSFVQASQRSPNNAALPGAGHDKWAWAMSAFGIMGLCTGVQIGGLYAALLCVGTLTTTWFTGEKFPSGPMLALGLIPLGLVVLVITCFPHIWTGFLEHARQTPAFTGLRMPAAGDFLKLLRNEPGLLAVAILLPWLFVRETIPKSVKLFQSALVPVWIVTCSCTFAVTAIMLAAMFFLTPMSVIFGLYLQPLIVGGYLALALSYLPAQRMRWQMAAFVALAALGSVRLVGMSTWGVACAEDYGYSDAMHQVDAELASCQPGTPVILSAQFLYQAARHSEVRWIHSDWMAPARRAGPSPDLNALIEIKPPKLILSQMDFFRRTEPILNELRAKSELADMKIVNMARISAPELFPPMRKVIQHISWAPVVVTLTWKPASSPIASASWSAQIVEARQPGS